MTLKFVSLIIIPIPFLNSPSFPSKLLVPSGYRPSDYPLSTTCPVNSRLCLILVIDFPCFTRDIGNDAAR